MTIWGGRSMKTWKRSTRSLFVSACLLLMLLVVVPAFHAEAASAKVRKNINKVIRVIRQSGDTNGYNEPVIQDDYDDNTSYYIVYKGNGRLYFGSHFKGDSGYNTYTEMNYHYNKSKANLEYTFFFSNGQDNITLYKDNVKPSSVRKGKKVGFRLDYANSTYNTGTNKEKELAELQFQDALYYWDVLLYREARLHLKDIGFTNYRGGSHLRE